VIEAMLKNLGAPELIIVGLVIVLLFGSRKIPEFMKGIGEAIKEFRNASKNE
jgi:sec-independent protein translocase protein TatA